MWTKLDDGILDHPKFAKVGLLGFGWFAAGLVYCNRNLTDGFIPWTIAHKLCPLKSIDKKRRLWSVAATCGMQGVGGGDDDKEFTEMVIEWLLSANLWREENGGYRVHDFLKYNPSRAKVLRLRRAARSRMKVVRANSTRTSPEVQVPRSRTRTRSLRDTKALSTMAAPLGVPGPEETRRRIARLTGTESA